MPPGSTSPVLSAPSRRGLDAIRAGGVFPAQPLALDRERRFDARRQRALTRYYLDAGANGLAVGVHSTQFAIREAGLYEQVLRTVSEAVEEHATAGFGLIAGVLGKTVQARAEARVAVSLGYDAALLGLGAFSGGGEDEILEHCRAIAVEIAVVGFYLQPAVGGLVLSRDFWRRFAELENVVAIKVAPFDRYRTLDVVRGVVEAGAESRIVLLTGNDDSILVDLLTTHRIHRDGEVVELRMKGGLLGHWCVWTHRAVELMRMVRELDGADDIPAHLLSLASAITDANSALFDAAHGYRGAIAGIHEVLRRQGLLEGIWCLDPNEGLSPGQAEELDRVHAAYPQLHDDAFVHANLQRWLS